MPGTLGRQLNFWDKVLLAEHPGRNDIFPWVTQGVSVFDFLEGTVKGEAAQRPLKTKIFPGRDFPDRTPTEHAQYIADEVGTVVAMGYLVT